MKKKLKTQRKHQARSTRSKKASTSSSNWDQSVRAVTGENPIPSADSSSETERGEFTPGEIGQVAPLDQEGEGNRQDDEARELEQIKPDRF